MEVICLPLDLGRRCRVLLDNSWPGDDHSTIGMPSALMSDRAQKRVLEPGVAPRSDDQEIGFAGRVEESRDGTVKTCLSRERDLRCPRLR